MRLNKFLLLPLLFVLSGCVSVSFNPPKPPPPNIVVTHNDVPIANPVIRPMDLQSVHFEVYDLTKLKTLVSQMEASGQNNVVFYVLDQTNFSSLGFNLSEMKRYIDDQKAKSDFLVSSIQINSGKPLTIVNPMTVPSK